MPLFFLMAFYTLIEFTSRKVAISNSGNTLLIWPYYLAFEIFAGVVLFKTKISDKVIPFGVVVFIVILIESIFNISNYMTISRLLVSLFFITSSIYWFFLTLRLKERKIEKIAFFWICSSFLAYHLPSLIYQSFEGGYLLIPTEYSLVLREARRSFNIVSKLLLTVGLWLQLK
ncbi:MAG: hypothetical protein VYB44_07235 [Bacteroidota bacterium]|nr:hypothetical protein [Bacteroidota bacterium]